MLIRELREEDRAGWQPLWDAYLAFYEQELEPGVTDDTFARLANRQGGLAGWVAENDRSLAGFVHTVVHPSTWTADRYVYLEDLFVAPDARRAGVGRALIEQVYEWAGDRHVYWHTQAANARARALYDQVAANSGFIVYERKDP